MAGRSLRRADLTKEQRMSLRQKVDEATALAVAKFLEPIFPGDDPEPMASEFAYESLLGAYIIEQNPYEVLAADARPKIPDDHDEEGRWVRKSGILRDRSVFSPLDTHTPIPAGQPFQFVFEDLPHLEDDLQVPESSPGPAPAPGDVPSDGIRQYAHNVVKIVRLRYAIEGRKKMPDGHFQRGFILMAYSGGDSSG